MCPPQNRANPFGRVALRHSPQQSLTYAFLNELHGMAMT